MEEVKAHYVISKDSISWNRFKTRRVCSGGTMCCERYIVEDNGHDAGYVEKNVVVQDEVNDHDESNPTPTPDRNPDPDPNGRICTMRVLMTRMM